MSDDEERAMRHAREVARMTDEEVAQELAAAGIDIEEERKRFVAWQASLGAVQKTSRHRRLLPFAAAAVLALAALFILLWVSLRAEPQPIAPAPPLPHPKEGPPTAEPLRVVENHQDFVLPQADAGVHPLNVPVAPNPDAE